MGSWRTLKGVDRFIFSGPSNIEGFDQIQLPNKTFTPCDTDQYLDVPEYWRKMFFIAETRNHLLKYGRQYDYALFLDADVEVIPDLIERLMVHEKDIVSPLVRVPTNIGSGWGFGYFTDGWHEGWHFNNRITAPLQKVDAVASSCMFLSNHIMNDSRLMFWPVKLKEDMYTGEDHGYCVRAKDLGYEAYVDTTIKLPHWKICWNHEQMKLELRPLRETDH